MVIDLFSTLEDLGNPLYVRVTAKAASNWLKLEHNPDSTILIRAYVTVAPENGKANKAVIALLSKALGLPKSSFTITHGLKNRDKTVFIANAALK
jgi:uncharacterized protein YggU (UPF0235/DUF167 family)